MVVTIDKEIQINTEPNMLFDLLTDPDQITKYYPYEKVESDREIGGKFICYGKDNAGPFTDKGTIEELNSPKEFSYRYWSTNHGTEDIAKNYLKISYRLEKCLAGTKLKLKHENISSKEYYSIMDGAWDYLLNNLKSYAESINA